MTPFSKISLALLLACLPFAASADSWDDDDDDDRGRYKQQYRDGHCKIKRELKKNGDFKEERRCKGRPYGGHVHAPMPVPVYGPAPVLVIDPGLTIHGTVTIRP